LELALIAPVIILLLVVAADFGRLFYLSVAVNNAARAGVQYGAQNVGDAADTGPNGGIVTAAKNDAVNIGGFTATATEFCQCDDGTTVTCPGVTGAKPCTNMSDMRIYVQCNTSATFTTITKWPGIPSSVTVNGQAVMREQ
jgi:Flp pilus assembly protein TadG